MSRLSLSFWDLERGIHRDFFFRGVGRRETTTQYDDEPRGRSHGKKRTCKTKKSAMEGARGAWECKEISAGN